MVSLLTRLLGFDQLAAVEDLVQDTFLAAFQTWKLKGTPDNPTAWLYQVARRKAFNYLKKKQPLRLAAVAEYALAGEPYTLMAGFDPAFPGIADAQLSMMFALCRPVNSPEAQIALVLKILCGFSVEEIARAFLTSKDTVGKRLYRAKEKLRAQPVALELPPDAVLGDRLESVLDSLYLLFNEGYYSASQETVLRKDLCLEAMRLSLLLLEHEKTSQPPVRALLALMCFHASRFESRLAHPFGLLPWREQDQTSWNQELIQRGHYYLNAAAQGQQVSSYHLEAALAYWHTQPDTPDKWSGILQLYDQLLSLKDHPMIRLNRAYIVAKVLSRQTAIDQLREIEGLEDSYLYYALLAELHEPDDHLLAKAYWQQALSLSGLESQRTLIRQRIALLSA